jgi:hypothetical protein
MASRHTTQSQPCWCTVTRLRTVAAPTAQQQSTPSLTIQHWVRRRRSQRNCRLHVRTNPSSANRRTRVLRQPHHGVPDLVVCLVDDEMHIPHEHLPQPASSARTAKTHFQPLLHYRLHAGWLLLRPQAQRHCSHQRLAGGRPCRRPSAARPGSRTHCWAQTQPIARSRVRGKKEKKMQKTIAVI